SPALLVNGEGSGDLDGRLHLRYGVLVTNAFEVRQIPRVLRGILGLQQILPGRVVEGSIDKRPGEPFDINYRYLPPGLQQRRWLARLLIGVIGPDPGG